MGALVHLHSHKLVHRDLKPSNIMWFEECHRFKLIDLAEACHSGAGWRGQGGVPPRCVWAMAKAQAGVGGGV